MDFREIGYQRTFWSRDFTGELYYEINATILAIGEYSYVFMEDNCIEELGATVATKRSETIRDEFDSIIYPRVTDLSGHPNGTLGDIDGDPRIIILFTRDPRCFYSPVNELIMNNSNECEMIYLDYRASQGNWRSFSLIAHEFQHLIWFNNEMDEPQFTLEALAQYAMYYSGYLVPNGNLARQVVSFLPHPEESLLFWNMYSIKGLNSGIDYGSAYLFAFYIAEHYGIEILRNLIMEPADGAQGIEAVLQAAGYNITFNELYLNWITALTIDQLGFGNNFYGFENIDARISRYDIVNELPLLNETISLRYYGFHIQKLQSPPNNFTVKIKKPSNQTIAVSIASHDALGWRVYQKIYDEPDTAVFDNIKGNSFDVTYIITSYIMNRTPPALTEYGLGPLAEIEISIYEGPSDSSQNPTTTSQSSTNTSKNQNIADVKNLDIVLPLSVFTGVCFLLLISVTTWRKKYPNK